MDDVPARAWPSRRLRGFDYREHDHAYFVTIRARPGTAPFTDPSMARQVIDALHWQRDHRQVHLYAYCLMPDHLHLLLRLPPDSQPLGIVIAAFKRFTTRQSWELGWSGRLWQSRFYDHVVREGEDAGRIARYIHQNPVRSGLVDDPDAYRYSAFPDPL